MSLTETTKKCTCGNTHLAHLRTINGGQKWCTDCNKYIPWKLEKGQKSLS